MKYLTRTRIATTGLAMLTMLAFATPGSAGPSSSTSDQKSKLSQAQTSSETSSVDQEPLVKAKEMTKVSLLMHWSVTSHDIGPFTALDKGWFKERNLDVTIQDGRGSVNTVQVVGAGTDTFGFADLSTYALAAKKLNLIAIAQIMQKSNLAVIYPENSDIKTFKDLQGKSLIYSAGSFEVPFLPTLWKANGIDPSTMKLINISPATKYSAYVSGQGDGLIAGGPTAISLARGIRDSKAFYFSDYGVVLPSLGYFTTQKVAEEQPDVVRAFVQAVLMGQKWSDEHPEEGVKILKKYYPAIDEKKVLQEQLSYIEFRKNPPGVKEGAFIMPNWEKAINMFAEIKLIPEAIPAGELVTNKFIPDALP